MIAGFRYFLKIELFLFILDYIIHLIRYEVTHWIMLKKFYDTVGCQLVWRIVYSIWSHNINNIFVWMFDDFINIQEILICIFIIRCDGWFYESTWMSHRMPRLSLGMSVRLFLGEISIWIDGLNKGDSPPQCGWKSFNT
jgi:hypothetical protein